MKCDLFRTKMPPPRGGRAWVDEHKKMSLRIPRERRRPTPVISIIGEESSPVEAVDDTKDSIPNRIVRGMRSMCRNTAKITFV